MLHFLPAFLTFLVALGLSTWAWRTARSGLVAGDLARFRACCDQVLQSVVNRFLAFEAVLRGVSGFLAANENLTEENWRGFVGRLQEVPGTESLKDILFVEIDRRRRARGETPGETGLGGLEGACKVLFVFPPGGADRWKSRNLLRAEPLALAFKYAAVTGLPALSDMVLRPGGDSTKYVVLCFPVVSEDSEKTAGRSSRPPVLGWVVGWIDVERLLRDVVDLTGRKVALDVYEGLQVRPAKRLYTDESDTQHIKTLPRHLQNPIQRRFNFGGRTWTFLCRPRKGFLPQGHPSTPFLVLLLGAFCSLVVGGLVAILTARRSEALVLAGAMTAALRESEGWAQKLALIAARTDKAAVILDRDGRIEWVNKSFCDLTELAEEEVLSKPFTAVLEGLMTDPAVLQQIEECLTAGKSFQGEILNASKYGRTYWLALEIQPNYDEEGRVANFTALGSDITQHKQAEEKLLGAKEAAEAASRAKSNFLANMSHEIRTPINGVVGMLKLLEETELTQRQQRYVRTALASADALMNVINDILDFSKIEAGKLELEDIPFDLYEVVENVMTMFAERAERKGLELAYHIDRTVPRFVRGDPNRLGQVLINLVGNAVKFTERGEVTLSLSVDRQQEGETACRFTVRDTGIGMSERQKARLFEPFSQGDSSTTRRYGGTGLGLAISRELVERMGGFMGLESRLGAGTTFWFVVNFPLAPIPEGKREEAGALAGLRVLVVDDHPATRHMFEGLLASWGCEVQGSGDPDEALALVRTEAQAGRPFRVVLIDRWLGRCDGLSLGKKILTQEGTGKPALLLVTTVSDTADEQAGKAGFFAAVAKPVRRSELFNALTACIGAARRREERSRAESTEPHGERKQSRGHVLIAEDNEINQEIAVEILTNAGFSCDCVFTGRQALEAVKKGGYDVVLMDWHMPEMDGFECAREIRKWEEEQAEGGKVPRIPIIALTANAVKGDRERCLKAGMDDYISKPLDPEKLVALVEKYFGVGKSVGNEHLESPAEPQADGGAACDLNFDELLRRCMGNEELARSLLGKFLVKAEEDIKELEEAVGRGDGETAAGAAHRFKGAAANIGAHLLREIAEQLEQASREGRMGEAVSLLCDLSDAYRRFAARAQAAKENRSSEEVQPEARLGG